MVASEAATPVRALGVLAVAVILTLAYWLQFRITYRSGRSDEDRLVVAILMIVFGLGVVGLYVWALVEAVRAIRS